MFALLSQICHLTPCHCWKNRNNTCARKQKDQSDESYLVADTAAAPVASSLSTVDVALAILFCFLTMTKAAVSISAKTTKAMTRKYHVSLSESKIYY